jgi:ubiquinone/menaquinone biosynthesis C-methylase UbiE
MPLFRKSQQQHLAVTMAGVKLGDRVLVAGCSDPAMIAGLALKTGLTGRACAVDESAERSGAAARITEAEGALVETSTAPLSNLPFDDESFDLVVLRDVLMAAPAENRIRIVQEVRRVLRGGGRSVVIESVPRRGLAGVLGSAPRVDAGSVTQVLDDAEFRAVRTLAERDGLLFVEAVKGNH